MHIKLYILTFIISVISTNTSTQNTSTAEEEQYHITDYILSFATYHFEWNPQYFTTKTLANRNIQACTKQIPNLCIIHTPQTPGFAIQYNHDTYPFTDDNLWTQINYIHSNQSILYTQDSLPIYEYMDEDDTYDYEDSESDSSDISPFQSPNPHNRRLLRRAKCRVYLYSRTRFKGRKGGTFRRRRYRRSSLRKKGFRSGGVKSVKVRGSRCCTAKLYTKDKYRGRRTRFRYGSYSRIRKKRHRISSLGSMKVYCSKSKRRRRRRRSRRRRRRSPCRGGGGGGGCGGSGGGTKNLKPIPILLGPMTGMLGHFGYSMHPIMPPQIAHMAGQMGNFGHGQGMPMMNHPLYGQPTMGSGYGMPPGQMMGMGNQAMGGMGGMMGGMGGMMGGMGGMHHMMHRMGMGTMGGMMGRMGMHPGMNGMPPLGSVMGQGPGGKTPVVHVYTDGGDGEEATSEEAVSQRRRLSDGYGYGYDGGALRKCIVVEGIEICATFYFGEGSVTMDYTRAMKTFLRKEESDSVDDSDEDYNVLVEYVSESEEDSEEDSMDEFEDLDEIMIAHEDYEMARNERLFGFKSEEEYNGGVDYVNTVVWVWKGHGCDSDMLKFMNMSVCSVEAKGSNGEKDIVIYNRYNGEMYDEEDEEDMKFRVRDEMDWDEIYAVHLMNRENKKLCKIGNDMKLCVEIGRDEYVSGNIKEMQISIEFL